MPDTHRVDQSGVIGGLPMGQTQTPLEELLLLTASDRTSQRYAAILLCHHFSRCEVLLRLRVLL